MKLALCFWFPSNIVFLVFRRNYHLECKKKWCNSRHFLHVLEHAVMIINSVVIPPTSLEMAIPQKDSIVWTVQSITREILHLNNNKMFIFLFENAGNYWLNAVFQTIMQ